ncbi:methyltransferase domain-containing protein [Microbacterium karelineae]|uniref:methyltransferase domain-containing protein n=1 Tax=Microbacterium karelineae TaxID=2654283 RepID=UPI0012E9BD04|nr:methyltransferase domain-containing protein [Microbacterium karelineae]
MSLSERDAHLAELMDDEACDPVRLRRTLARFAIVNRVVSGWDRAYRARLRPVLATLGRPARVLDIGCGSGDVLRRITRLARVDGFAVDATGIDPDPRALAVAMSTERMHGVSYRRAVSRDLVAEGARFDIVVSNHLLHHLDADGLDGVLADSEALAERLCLHSDIARGRIAYTAYAIGVTPLAPGSFLRTDGLRSIRRSYTRPELAAALRPGWTVERPAAFRLLAVHRPAPAGA